MFILWNRQAQAASDLTFTIDSVFESPYQRTELFLCCSFTNNTNSTLFFYNEIEEGNAGMVNVGPAREQSIGRIDEIRIGNIDEHWGKFRYALVNYGMPEIFHTDSAYLWEAFPKKIAAYNPKVKRKCIDKYCYYILPPHQTIKHTIMVINNDLYLMRQITPKEKQQLTMQFDLDFMFSDGKKNTQQHVVIRSEESAALKKYLQSSVQYEEM